MNNRLYVGNLAFTTTQDALEQTFAQYGDVTEVKVMLDRDTGRSRGFAFVEMASEDGAQRAIEALNGSMVDGRPLRVNEAEARRESSGGGGGFGRRKSGGRY